MAEELTEVTPELIEQLTELARTGELTAKDLKSLSTATKQNESFMKDLGKASVQASKTFAKGFANATASVASGANEFDTMKTIVSAAGEAMASLLETIPFVGKALAGLTRAAVQVANIAIERLQVSFNAFQELSKQGLIGAQGISGLREQMIRARIPMEKWQNILSNNSDALAYFSGSALQGAQSLSNAMYKMQDGQGMQLRRLGFSIEEIGDTVVDFQKMQRFMGQRQQYTTDDLIKKSTEYGRELDFMAKLTGQSRKEIQKRREQMMMNTRWAAWNAQLEKKISPERRRAITDFVAQIKHLAPTMGEGIRDLFASGGVATTQAGQRLIQQGMGPTVMRIRRMMMSGQMDQASAQRELFKAALKNRDKFRDLSAIVGEFGAGIPFEEMQKLAQAEGMTTKQIKEMQDAQKSQMSGQDKLTDQLTRTVMNLEHAQTKLDALATTAGFAGMMVETFSKALLAVAKTLYKMTGMSDEEVTAVMRAKDQAVEAQGLGIQGKVKGKGKEAKFVVSEADYAKGLKEYEERQKRINALKEKGAKATQAEKDELKSLEDLQAGQLKKLDFMRRHQEGMLRTEKARKELFNYTMKSRTGGMGRGYGGTEEQQHFMSEMGLTGGIDKTRAEMIRKATVAFQKEYRGKIGDLEDLQDRIQKGTASQTDVEAWNELKKRVAATGQHAAQLDAFGKQKSDLAEYIRKAKESGGGIDEKERAYIEAQTKHLEGIRETLTGTYGITAIQLRRQNETLEQIKKMVQK